MTLPDEVFLYLDVLGFHGIIAYVLVIYLFKGAPTSLSGLNYMI